MSSNVDSIPVVAVSAAAMSDGRCRFVTIFDQYGESFILDFRNDGSIYFRAEEVEKLEGRVPWADDWEQRLLVGEPCKIHTASHILEITEIFGISIIIENPGSRCASYRPIPFGVLQRAGAGAMSMIDELPSIIN